MQDFISKIKNFYYSNKLLSWLLVFSFFCFSLLKEEFYVSAFFTFILFFASSIWLKKVSYLNIIFSGILGTVIGGGLFLLWKKIFFIPFDLPFFSAALQSAIIAVLMATASYMPNHSLKILISKFKLKYIAVILVILNLMSVNEPALYLAHVGSVAMGLMYGLILRLNHQRRWKNVLSFFKLSSYRKPKMKASYSAGKRKSDDEYNNERVDRQKKIDAILDKISKSGYDSLTKEEKDFLFTSSK